MPRGPVKVRVPKTLIYSSVLIFFSSSPFLLFLPSLPSFFRYYHIVLVPKEAGTLISPLAFLLARENARKLTCNALPCSSLNRRYISHWFFFLLIFSVSNIFTWFLLELIDLYILWLNSKDLFFTNCSCRINLLIFFFSTT